MAGPTPVSALIHAATMVTSGVYLLTRMNPVLAEAAGWSIDMIWIVGLFTALFAATAAIAQTISKSPCLFDSKPTWFHVRSSWVRVIRRCHLPYDHSCLLQSTSIPWCRICYPWHASRTGYEKIWSTQKVMPITAFTFIIGWLAIAGIPPFSGFWSKDEVLLAAWNENKIAWAMLLIAAIMTAFYMSRLVS
ncbi:MAG: hypothetical protein CM15mP49_19560 [Actinomycetota bacterium]|nr:MAG: hypothetical protein CM15mP49_19560 [Actinomycetota bacterium]